MRGQKESNRGNVARLADAAERSLRDGRPLEIGSDENAAVATFRLDNAGTEAIDSDLLWTELPGESGGDGVDCRLAGVVNRTVRSCSKTCNGANVDDAAPLFQVLHSGLRCKQE